MVICDSIVQSSRSERLKSANKSKKKSFFDLWGRHEAHEFTFEILRTLGFEDEVDRVVRTSDSDSGLYDLFNHLPLPIYNSANPPDFRLIQARALFQKNNDFKSGIDQEAAAFSSWLQSEAQCLQTNLRWEQQSFSPEEQAITFYASQFIARVLGDCPRLEDLELEFGPGAATSCSNNTTARWKLSSPLTASNSLFRIKSELESTVPGWLSNTKWIPSCGALEFASKNYLTHRSIEEQPLLNGFVQKGIGTKMKRCLLKAGINLYDQSINKERARKGSIYNDVATIDLSRASDTLSYSTVMNLLPWDWFNLLDAARTEYATYKGQLFVLQKFSAMGNGYTFELESLIFAALCWAIEEFYNFGHNTTVYGDDIVTSINTGLMINKHFPSYGFSVNEEKSFIDGPFRESCGGDYHLGVDVRPFFLRGLRTQGRWTYATCVSFHNFLQRKPWFDPDQKVRRLLVSKVPKKYQMWGPDGYGDGHLVSQAPLSSYAHRPKKWLDKGYEGYLIKTVVAIPHRNTQDTWGDRFLPSYLAGKGPQADIFAIRTPKSSRMKCRIVDMYVV